jgi:hypothetical protein
MCFGLKGGEELVCGCRALLGPRSLGIRGGRRRASLRVENLFTSLLFERGRAISAAENYSRLYSRGDERLLLYEVGVCIILFIP